MNKKVIVFFASLTLLAAPLLALALSPTPRPATIEDIWPLLENILSLLWKIFSVIAIVMFMAAGYLFLTAQGDPAKNSIAKHAVVYGVVGIVVAIVGYSAVGIISGLLVPAPAGSGAAGMGACLDLEANTCLNGTTLNGCSGANQVYLGDNSSCPSIPTPTGACCYGSLASGGDCLNVTQYRCENSPIQTGRYRGDGSACINGPAGPNTACPQ